MSGYAVLLRLYPSDHPRDEMLGVLEENGLAWYREAPSLILGAVRARTGRRQPVGLRWLYAARAAALMLLTAGVTTQVLSLEYGVQLRSNLMVATWICAGLAAVAVVWGARFPAFGAALAALLLCTVDQTGTEAIAGYTLAAVLLLIPGRPTPVRNPLPVLLALSWTADYLWSPWVGTSLLMALLLWTVVDERVLLAGGLALFGGLITVTGSVAEVDDTRGRLILAAWHLGLPTLVLAAAAALTYHRARPRA